MGARPADVEPAPALKGAGPYLPPASTPGSASVDPATQGAKVGGHRAPPLCVCHSSGGFAIRPPLSAAPAAGIARNRRPSLPCSRRSESLGDGINKCQGARCVSGATLRRRAAATALPGQGRRYLSRRERVAVARCGQHPPPPTPSPLNHGLSDNAPAAAVCQPARQALGPRSDSCSSPRR